MKNFKIFNDKFQNFQWKIWKILFHNDYWISSWMIFFHYNVLSFWSMGCRWRRNMFWTMVPVCRNASIRSSSPASTPRKCRSPSCAVKCWRKWSSTSFPSTFWTVKPSTISIPAAPLSWVDRLWVLFELPHSPPESVRMDIRNYYACAEIINRELQNACPLSLHNHVQKNEKDSSRTIL